MNGFLCWVYKEMGVDTGMEKNCDIINYKFATPWENLIGDKWIRG